MNIKAAIFDMDGTLVNSLIFWEVLWTEFGKRFLSDSSFRPTEKDDKTVRTLTMKDAMEHIHRVYNIGKDGKELLDIANEMMVEFYSNEVEMKPGALEFLEHLKSNGTRMVIASATSPDLINLALKHCEIEHYFERLFSCADIGKGKDEPDVFLAALDYLGNDLSETWVFEDSAVAIETAVKAGFNTVAIYDKNNFGQDLMKKIATRYIAEGQGLDLLI